MSKPKAGQASSVKYPPNWTRREFIRTSAGLYVAAVTPTILSTGCDPEQVEAVIRLIELALVVADRVAGALETRTRSSKDANTFVYECLYGTDSSGAPLGSPLQENERRLVVTPAGGSWHSSELTGFEVGEEGDFVVVAEGTGLYTVSDRFSVRA
ncbi:MAG: hypothetical protein H6716_26520 [Polyangiaceae bacterium]|nr:hypothetical protein [Polyangiaceae bacterium]MCB9647676.1 hypothetical protein [Deltaproteobacteria bacterium]